jgi:hypothetical protein
VNSGIIGTIRLIGGNANPVTPIQPAVVRSFSLIYVLYRGYNAYLLSLKQISSAQNGEWIQMRKNFVLLLPTSLYHISDLTLVTDTHIENLADGITRPVSDTASAEVASFASDSSAALPLLQDAAVIDQGVREPQFHLCLDLFCIMLCLITYSLFSADLRTRNSSSYWARGRRGYRRV